MVKRLLLGGVGGALAYVAYAARCPRAQRWGRSFYRGRPGRRQIALTFDDGPSEATPGVLEVLDRYQVPATFFFCGMNVERLPDLARQARQAGHEIGNHTYSHPCLLALPRSRVRAELGRTQAVLRETVGVRARLFRPPYGVRAPGLQHAQQELGLITVMWTVIGNDWKWTSAAIARRILEKADDGGIVCLHDGREVQALVDRRQTVMALGRIVPSLQEQGFSFVTVTEMLKEAGRAETEEPGASGRRRPS